MEMAELKAPDIEEEQQETEFTDLMDPTDLANERQHYQDEWFLPRREHIINYQNDWLSTEPSETPGLDVLFTGQAHEARNIGYFLDDVLLPEKDVINPRFIKYLMENADASVKKTLTESGIITNYEISFYGEPYRTDEGFLVRPTREFKTTDGVIPDPVKFNQAVSDIRYHYDEFLRKERLWKMKRAGVVTAAVLGVSGLITGLALGLKRRGSDMVRNGKQQKGTKNRPIWKVMGRITRGNR